VNPFVVILPVPPSLNGLYAGKARRHKSEAYKDWLKEASDVFAAQKPSYRTFTGRLTAKYCFGFPDKKRRDIGNFEKALSDFLVDMRVMNDDSQIDTMILKRLYEPETNGVWIQITEEAGE